MKLMNKDRAISMLAGAFTAVVILAGTAHAGLFDSMVTSGWSDKEVESKYTMEVHGFDVRVYEWIPEENPNVRMVFLAGEKSSGVGSYTITPPKTEEGF